MTNHTLQKKLFQLGTTLLGISVMMGAFGAHQLKTILNPVELETYNTGLQYQFIHAAALLLLSLNLRKIKEKTARITALIFSIGIVIFCGTLYILAIRNSIGLEDKYKWIGALTPIGGTCFIGGWFYLAYNGLKPSEGNHSDYIKPARTKHSEA